MNYVEVLELIYLRNLDIINAFLSMPGNPFIPEVFKQ